MIVLNRGSEQKNIYDVKISGVESVSQLKDHTIFELEIWEKFKAEISKFSNFGVLINSDKKIEDIDYELNLIKIIQINFLSFKDGRPFTLIKSLRKKYFFKNEIRASGQILPDQYNFLLRCGVDTVEIKNTQKDIWIKVLNMESKESYQPS